MKTTMYFSSSHQTTQELTFMALRWRNILQSTWDISSDIYLYACDGMDKIWQCFACMPQNSQEQNKTMAEAIQHKAK